MSAIGYLTESSFCTWNPTAIDVTAAIWAKWPVRSRGVSIAGGFAPRRGARADRVGQHLGRSRAIDVRGTGAALLLEDVGTRPKDRAGARTGLTGAGPKQQKTWLERGSRSDTRSLARGGTHVEAVHGDLTRAPRQARALSDLTESDRRSTSLIWPHNLIDPRFARRGLCSSIAGINRRSDAGPRHSQHEQRRNKSCRTSRQKSARCANSSSTG